MKTFVLIATLAATLATPAYAQPAVTDHSAHHPAPAKGGAATMADGEVRRIDKEAKKITLRHGPIVNLDMPPMTMVFQVKDAALLDKVNTGDKVRFAAEKEGSAYIVTRIEAAK